VAAYGPAAISVDAGGSAWQNYQSGVMPADHCKSAAVGKLDHAVQLVGYGQAKQVHLRAVSQAACTRCNESCGSGIARACVCVERGGGGCEMV
jgi:hypothetical protein